MSTTPPTIGTTIDVVPPLSARAHASHTQMLYVLFCCAEKYPLNPYALGLTYEPVFHTTVIALPVLMTGLLEQDE